MSLGKKHGGLALGGLENKNVALLGIWLWRFPLEQHSLWASIIRSKFGHSFNCWVADHFPSFSYRSIWKGISQAYLSLPLTKIRFWLDPWLDSQPFSVCFASFSISPHLKRVPSLSSPLLLLFGIFNFAVTLPTKKLRNS